MPIQVTDLPEKYQKAVLDQLKAAYGKQKARGSSKYHAEKVTVNGITFDSKKEARRFLELTALEQAGKIHGLRRQVKYLLIPEQRESCAEIYKSGPKKGQFKPGRVLERECSYYANQEDLYFVSISPSHVEDNRAGLNLESLPWSQSHQPTVLSSGQPSGPASLSSVLLVRLSRSALP